MRIKKLKKNFSLNKLTKVLEGVYKKWISKISHSSIGNRIFTGSYWMEKYKDFKGHFVVDFFFLFFWKLFLSIKSFLGKYTHWKKNNSSVDNALFEILDQTMFSLKKTEIELEKKLYQSKFRQKF